MLTISGANREVTEGVTALIAAAMLLYVGYWLHSKSYAQAWQNIHPRPGQRRARQAHLWAMASISFLAVYRELFEIILFYETLWVQVGPAGHAAVLGGIAVAAVLLAVIGWAILKYSVRLPIGPFFTRHLGTAGIMAVVFAGNGVAALQEAGVIDSTPGAFRFAAVARHPSDRAGAAAATGGAGAGRQRRPDLAAQGQDRIATMRLSRPRIDDHD